MAPSGLLFPRPSSNRDVDRIGKFQVQVADRVGLRIEKFHRPFDANVEMLAERIRPNDPGRIAGVAEDKRIVRGYRVRLFQNDRILRTVEVKINSQRLAHHLVSLLIQKDLPAAVERDVYSLPIRYRRPTHKLLALPVYRIHSSSRAVYARMLHK